MLTLAGKGVSPGLAKGTAFVYVDVVQRDSELSQIDPAEVGEEQARIERAIDDVRQSLITKYLIDDHPAVLRLIELVVRESGDVPVSLCGELAGRIDVMPSLLRTGIRSLSVPAALVPDVKNAIRLQALDTSFSGRQARGPNQ